MDDIDTALSTLSSAAAGLDEAARKALIDKLAALSRSLESPYDSMQRILYTNMQLPIVRIAIDLNLFKLLEEEQTTAELAEKTGASATIVERFLRYLAATGMIDETGQSRWRGNKISKTLTEPGWIAGVGNYLEIGGPIWAVAPTWFKDNHYQDVIAGHTPFQAAFNTDLTPFAYLPSQPHLWQHLHGFMAMQRTTQPSSFSSAMIEAASLDLGDRALFVDIGGSMGHQSAKIREMVPDPRNEVINEDLPATLKIAPDIPGVRKLVQDFFLPQQIIGAKIYYLRNILHDWRDDDCVKILSNTRAALANDSVIWIDEMVLSMTGTPWQATQLDMTMLVALGARERNIEQWETLVGAAGLRIKAIHKYTQSLGDSLIECVAI